MISLQYLAYKNSCLIHIECFLEKVIKPEVELVLQHCNLVNYHKIPPAALEKSEIFDVLYEGYSRTFEGFGPFSSYNLL